jgi:hypothetical protein
MDTDQAVKLTDDGELTRTDEIPTQGKEKRKRKNGGKHDEHPLAMAIFGSFVLIGVILMIVALV